jgi:hypothetical protein
MPLKKAANFNSGIKVKFTVLSAYVFAAICAPDLLKLKVQSAIRLTHQLG